ncbi:flippase [Thomasclavelia cocleata]|uniref:Membrane protein involved in the export of O-antigen and teichoic acid n=1 Tax=Thomasclavelia cocleata TaxID=69824 RepID=A0A1I0D763_9FIRM|nr:flippase [Thomasclavelia cocleata]MCR1960451.1 flippase [Thomasclavelia cocleata]NDO41988.1 flippase [Thomasclavelia cocleata]PJN80972.1 flippase [Thomasclavelia cocleata]SET28095.1 Membrane protein involved in the export of O-antigen and teichoic acid [Thomasclavelia cocleata]
MNKLIKNYIYNVGYQIFLIVVPVITAPYLARILGPTQLGIYSYVNSVTSIITTVGLLGLQSYAYREIAYVRDNNIMFTKTVSQIFLLRIFIFVIISIFYVPYCYISDYSTYFFVQYLLVLSVFLDVSWIFIGMENLGIVAFRNFVAKLITVIGIFIFIKSRNDLWIYFFLFSFVTFITTISMFPIVKKYIKFSNISLKDIFNHIIPSIKLFIPQIATMLYLQFDKIMLQILGSGSEQVAFYDQAEKFINIPLTVITALCTVMVPRIANLYANKNFQSIEYYMNKTIKFSLFLSVPMMFGLISISEELIPWYLGSSFQKVSLLVIFLSPLTIMNSISNVFGAQYLTATNKTQALTISYYSAAILNIFLNAYLIPTFDSIGTAVATIISILFSIIIQYVFVKRDLIFNFNLKNILNYFFASMLMGIIVKFIGISLGSHLYTTFLQILIGASIYMMLMILFKDEICLLLLTRIKKLNRKRVKED